MRGVSDPARQSLARPVTPVEQALADALEAIFATGCHDFAEVAGQLNRHRVARPSGAAEDWTVEALTEELRVVNASFDAAYEAGGSDGRGDAQ